MAEAIYCNSCKKRTRHKRDMGTETFIEGVLTSGLSWLTIPIYPLSCVVCGDLVNVTYTRIVLWTVCVVLFITAYAVLGGLLLK